jgi:hypothetical protein
MNGLDEEALRQWAKTHDTSIEIAEQIFTIADGDDDAELWWNDCPADFREEIILRGFECADPHTEALHWGAETLWRKDYASRLEIGVSDRMLAY